MRISYILIFLLIILQSCQSDVIIDNKPIIAKIDNFKFNKTILEVSVDDEDNIIDTIAIEKFKINEGKTLYSIKELWGQDRKFTKKTYFRNNEDLFYQIIDYGTDRMKTEFETFVNKENIIDKAQMINYYSEDIDTIFMKYNFKYSLSGKIKSLSIITLNDSINSLSVIKYNDYEKYESTVITFENDTIEKSSAKYLNENIIELTQEYRSNNSIEIYNYGNNEEVRTRRTFRKVNDSLILKEEYTYKYNSDNELQRIFIQDIENDTIKRLKFITSS